MLLFLANSVQYKVDIIKELYASGKTFKNNPQRIISYGFEDGCDIMREKDENGRVLRESTFEDGILTKIVEFKPDNKKTEIWLADGKLSSYKEGYEKFENGENAHKFLLFDSGKISLYYEDMGDIEIGLHLRYDEDETIYEHAKILLQEKQQESIIS